MMIFNVIIAFQISYKLFVFNLNLNLTVNFKFKFQKNGNQYMN